MVCIRLISPGSEQSMNCREIVIKCLSFFTHELNPRTMSPEIENATNIKKR
jgi:hypothetical protein